MELHHEGNVIYRSLPRENMEINKFWLCDEGRFHFNDIQREDRWIDPCVQDGIGARSTDWATALDVARATLGSKKIAVLAGTDLTLEEAKQLQDASSRIFGGAPLFHFGTPGIETVSQDGPADPILKRKSKTSNLKRFEKLGIAPFGKLPAGIEAVLVVRGGRATVPELKGVSVVGLGVFNKPEVENFVAILPGLSFAEKDGTIVNYEGREQKVKRALNPLGQSKALSEVLMLWMNSKGTTPIKRSGASAEGVI